MKKNLFFVLWLGVFTSAVNAQQWVNFTSREPQAPIMNLLTSTAKSVTFEVTIPGIYTLDTVVNGTTFTRLMLQGALR